MEFNKINNLFTNTMKYQGLLLKNGLKFKVNLEILTIRANQ